MAGRKNFVAGEILTASDVNSFLMDQSVMVFDDSAARGSAIPSPTEGMVTYRKDEKTVEVFDGSSYGPIGKILQVVSATKTDFASTTSTSFQDVSGLSVTVTPSSTSSKILVLSNVSLGRQNIDPYAQAVLLRGTTQVNIGDSLGSAGRTSIYLGFGINATHPMLSLAHIFLDSPNTTSATTYKWQFRSAVGGRTAYINRSAETSFDAGTGVSNITVMEVAG